MYGPSCNQALFCFTNHETHITVLWLNYAIYLSERNFGYLFKNGKCVLTHIIIPIIGINERLLKFKMVSILVIPRKELVTAVKIQIQLYSKTWGMLIIMNPLHLYIITYIPEPLYNMVCYNTVLDITRIRVGPQKAISYFFSYITYGFYSQYNMDWIANREIGLDPKNSVIKRLWCMYR